MLLEFAVDPGACIGCRGCVQAYPEIFGMADDKAMARTAAPRDTVRPRRVVQCCPVDAIQLVAGEMDSEKVEITRLDPVPGWEAEWEKHRDDPEDLLERERRYGRLLQVLREPGLHMLRTELPRRVPNHPHLARHHSGVDRARSHSLRSYAGVNPLAAAPHLWAPSGPERSTTMRLASAFLLSAMGLFCAAAAGAQDVTAGLDYFVSISPGSSQTFQGPYALPADFFGPGSDPFEGTVALVGDPLGPSPLCPGPLGPTDTVVRRPFDAFLPGPPSTVTVPIEIVALNLVSVSPITVTYPDLHTEQWNVRVTLSPVPPATPGVIRIVLQAPQGGTFSSQLPVRPIFTFTRTSPPDTRILEPWGPAGSFFDVWVDVDVPWSYSGPPSLLDTPCDSNFRPTVQGGVVLVDRVLHGPYTTLLGHWPLVGTVTARSSSWGALKTLYR